MLQQILDFKLIEISGTVITVSTLLAALLIALAAFWISKLLQRGLARAVARRGMERLPNVAVMGRLLHYVIVLIGFAVALDTLGINLGALFAAGAIFAVGIGFAMQNIAQNFVSGVILLLERSIKPGDVLAIEGAVVRVIDQGIRTTLVRTRDDEELIVPNSVLVQGTVKNYTLHDSMYRLRAQVGVVYSSDMRHVSETLRKVAESVTWRSDKRNPRVLLKEFGSSSVDFDVSVWMDDPWEAPRALAQLNEAIWFALKDANITIAFPQLDVHFDPNVSEAVSRIGAPGA